MAKIDYYIFCLLAWIICVGIIVGFVGIPIWFYLAGDKQNAIASAGYIWTILILLITSDYITYLRNKYEKKSEYND